MIIPISKIKIIIILMKIFELELRMAKRLRGILKDFRELNRERRSLCKEEQSKRIFGRS